MKKLIGLLFVTIALTSYGQEKVNIAEMLIERNIDYLQKVIVNEYSTTDTIKYEQETRDFMTALTSALKNYRMACDSSVIDYDSLIVDLENKIAHLENKFDKEKLLRAPRYRKMKIQLQQYQELIGSQLNEWVQPTGAHDAYQKRDKVLHKGKEWISLIDANVWEPGVSGWREL